MDDGVILVMGTPTTGKALRLRRVAAGLGVAELGATLGVSPQRVYAWESNQRPIPLARSRQIADLLAGKQENRLSEAGGR